MVSIDNARVATCIAAAALAGASAVAFPTVARADDSSAPTATLPLPDVPAGATATAAAAMGDEETDALADTIAAALDPAGVVDGGAAAESPAPSPEPVAAASVPEAAPSADPAPTTGSAPEQPTAQSADIKGHAADTTGDTASAAGSTSPSTATSRPAVAAQSAPSNVNVNVRIDSPGDNGAVTQVNISAAAAIGVSNGAAPSSSTPASAQAAAPSSPSTGASRPATAISSPGSATSSDVDPAADTWAWQWDCLSAPSLAAISPNSSTSGSLPKNWTWIWNCGDNSGQYQSGTASQYQPVNMNVSIRISSPGNDGPVSQSNVAIAVSAGRTSPDGHTPAGSSPSPSPPVSPGASFPGIPSLPPIASLPGLSSLPAVLSPVVSVSPSLVEGGDVSGLVVGAALSFGDEPVELPFVLPGLGGDGTPWLTGVGPIHGGAIADVRMGAWASETDSRLAPTIVGAAGRPSSIEAAATSSKRSDAERRAKPAPRWRTPVPTSPAPESAPMGASAAASTGSGSSGGGLPVFLALPFLVALLDLARRVALERAASPSEHRSRMPDTPG